jgi:excisionase family DNA binding protein
MNTASKPIESRTLDAAKCIGSPAFAPSQQSFKISFTVAEVCAATGLGKTSVFEAIKSGELPSVFRCGRRLVLKDDLEVWLRGDRSAA